MSARDRVTDLVPFVHVADVDRSIAFYALLGFAPGHEFAPDGRRVWGFLERGDARLAHLVANGVDAGEITTGGPGPDRQMAVDDPDGYRIMLAEIEGERVGVLPG